MRLELKDGTRFSIRFWSLIRDETNEGSEGMKGDNV